MKNKVVYTLIVTLFIIACSEDMLDVKNDSEYDGTSFFTTATSYEEASTAMYSPLIFSGLYANNYFFFDLFGNDADRNFPLTGSPLEYPLYTHTPNNGYLNSFWNSCYKIVLRSNFVLDLMDKWETKDDTEVALKQRITGEAQFLKSFAYFWLVTCYGDVPFRNTLEDHYLIEFGRTPKEEIWAAIEENLQSAIDNLPLSYDADDYGRATKGAAVALLGKSYLYQQKYSEAITELSKLRNAPYDYELASSLDDMFIYDLKTKETIFAVIHGEWQGWGVGNAYYMFDGQETWGSKATHSCRSKQYGFNDWWNTVLSDALIDAFTYEDESASTYLDPRAELTYYSDNTQGGDTTWCDDCEEGILIYSDLVTEGQVSWRKYEMYEYVEAEGTPQSGINMQVIRYADVLLMLAEAYIETNDVNSALPLINEVRARSNAFEYTTLGSQSQARSILRRERRLELAGEQSRYPDLVRWGILVETINAEKQASNGVQPVKDYHVLFPIPLPERDANPTLNEQVNNNWN